MNTVIGIDPSLSGTAVCVWTPAGNTAIERFGSAPAPGMERIVRFMGLSADVNRFIRETCFSSTLDGWNPVLTLIEGYSFGSKGKSITDIAEYGGILRSLLLPLVGRMLEVAPGTLKKFATGKGNGDKALVAAHVAKRWGVICDNNDETDAYVLARLAACCQGWIEAETEPQRDCVATVLEGPKPKRKKVRMA